MSVINLICPDFVIGRPVYEVLLPLVKEYPYIQQEGRRIYSVYGNYPGMIWAGGWVNIKGEVALQEKIVEDLRFYNTYEVRLTLTLTNTQLNKIHLLDTYCNLVCAIFNQTNYNSALTVDEKLEEHLKSRYPNINLHKSIVATKDRPYPENWRNYEMVVLRRSLNPELKNISLSPELMNKAEILCNDLCLDNCQRLYEHYDIDSSAALWFSENISGITCPYMKEKGSPFCQYFREHELKTYISPSKVSELAAIGFKNFKLSGRGNLPHIVETVVSYLIKPEYQSDVRQLIYHHILEGGKRNGN